MSISLDPDQAGHFVGPDLGPNCLQRLSVGDTSRQRVEQNQIQQQQITLSWFYAVSVLLRGLWPMVALMEG